MDLLEVEQMKNLKLPFASVFLTSRNMKTSVRNDRTWTRFIASNDVTSECAVDADVKGREARLGYESKP